MSSRAGLDTGENKNVVPLPELHVIFSGCPSRMLVTMLPELSRIDLASCHEERKNYGVKGNSALNPVCERKTQKEKKIIETEKEYIRKQGKKNN
jgi:hypothetical protein